MTRRITQNRTSAHSRSHSLSGCDTSHPDPGAFAGIYVEIVRRDGEDWPAGDVPRPNLLRWRDVGGRLVYDETPRTFFPHSAAGALTTASVEGCASDSRACPAPGPDAVGVAGPGVTPGVGSGGAA